MEDIYIPDKVEEIKIGNTTIKIKLLPGVDYLEIVNKSTNADGTIRIKEFAKEIISACVVEPKIEVERLTPGAVTKLLSEIARLHGVTADFLQR